MIRIYDRNDEKVKRVDWGVENKVAGWLGVGVLHGGGLVWRWLRARRLALNVTAYLKC
jgi:hypothetical protein